MTKILLKYILIIGLTIVLILLTLFPILSLNSWTYTPPSYIEGGEQYSDMLSDADFSQNANYIVTASKNIDFFSKTSSIPLWTYKSKDYEESFRLVAISYDGKFIAAGSGNGEILIFDSNTPNPLWSYSTSNHINAIDISDNGNFIAVVTSQGGLFRFNKTDSNPLWNYLIGPKFVEISSNGSFVVVRGVNILYVFPSSGLTPLWNYTFANEIKSMALDHNEDKILVGCEDGTIYYFNSTNPIPLWSCFTNGSVNDLSLSSDGKSFVACVNYSLLYYFENSSTFPTWIYQSDKEFNLDWFTPDLYASISGDGNYIVLNQNKYYFLFHRSNSSPIWETKHGSGWVYHYGMGKTLISYNGDYYATLYDGELFFYNRHNPGLLRDFDEFYLWLIVLGYPSFGIISFLIIYRNIKTRKRKR